MKAISLHQPWASLIAIGAKRIETRSWPANFKGIIAIHAAKRPVDDYGHELLHRCWSPEIDPISAPSGCPLGCIVALCTLVESILIDRKTANEMPEPEKSFGDYTVGRYGWLLTNLHKLETPVPCIGRQRLFNLPADVEARVREQVPAWAFVGSKS